MLWITNDANEPWTTKGAKERERRERSLDREKRERSRKARKGTMRHNYECRTLRCLRDAG